MENWWMTNNFPLLGPININTDMWKCVEHLSHITYINTLGIEHFYSDFFFLIPLEKIIEATVIIIAFEALPPSNQIRIHWVICKNIYSLHKYLLRSELKTFPSII